MERPLCQREKDLEENCSLKQIHGDDLTWKIIEDEIKKFHVNSNAFDLQQTSLSYFFYLRNTTKGKILEFIHKTFKEYLLAEYYLESILENKPHRLNVRMPSH